jgi:uncharacterized protein YutE (UPF0331/DUF86 family)
MCALKTRWTRSHSQSDVMNTEQRLSLVVDRYKAQGYQVVVRPGPDDLPPFAKDFKVEILAKRADGGVLASAKMSAAELEADADMPRYAEITNNQPGWRFDVFVLGADNGLIPEKRDATEPSDEDIRRNLDDVERMLQQGFVAQSLIAAWAALESAMRRRLRAEGEKAGWGTSPRTMLNELFSAGVLANSVFRDLEGLFQLRSAIVHGFAPPVVDESAVQLLVDTAQRLLDESLPVKQTA